MLYRLTFALTRDEIVTLEFASDKEIVGATEEAYDLIERDYGAETVMRLVAFSLLKVEGANVQ